MQIEGNRKSKVVVQAWIERRRAEGKWFQTDHCSSWSDVNEARRACYGPSVDPREDGDDLPLEGLRLDLDSVIRVESHCEKYIDLIVAKRVGYYYEDEVDEVEVRIMAVDPIRDQWGHCLDYVTIVHDPWSVEHAPGVVYYRCGELTCCSNRDLNDLFDSYNLDDLDHLPDEFTDHLEVTKVHIIYRWSIHGDEQFSTDVYTSDLDVAALVALARDLGLIDHEE